MTAPLANPMPKPTTGTTGTTGSPVDVTQLHRAFEAHYARVHPIVCHIVRGSGLPDEDDVIGDVAEHLWCQFPAHYQEEQEDLAAGKPSRHKWFPFLCEIARNRVFDHFRHHGLTRPNRGADRKRDGEAPSPEDPSPEDPSPEDPSPEDPSTRAAESTGRTRASDRRGWEVPLKYDENLAAPPEADPAVLFEQREERNARAFLRADQRALLPAALAYLESVAPDQFNALQTSLHDLSDDEATSLLQIDRFTIYRRRRAAIRTLRHFYAQRGFSVPTSTPPARI